MSTLTALLFTVAALSAATAGFAGLSLAMDRHWQGIYGRGAAPEPGRRRLLQGLGSVALLASLACCLAVRDSAQAFVMWVGLLTAAAWIAVSLLTYGARKAGRAARAAGLLACAAGASGVLLHSGGALLW
jgi:hypothetical protein